MGHLVGAFFFFNQAQVLVFVSCLCWADPLTPARRGCLEMGKRLPLPWSVLRATSYFQMLYYRASHKSVVGGALLFPLWGLMTLHCHPSSPGRENLASPPQGSQYPVCGNP